MTFQTQLNNLYMSCSLLFIGRGSFYNVIWIYNETSKQWTHWRQLEISDRGCPYPGYYVFEPCINHMNRKLLVAHMSAHAVADESSYHTVLPYWMLWWASNLHSHHRCFLNHCQPYVHSHSGVIRLLCSYSRVLTTLARNTKHWRPHRCSHGVSVWWCSAVYIWNG